MSDVQDDTRQAGTGEASGAAGSVASPRPASVPPSRMTPADYPALFQAADARARTGQRVYRSLVGAELAFVIGGAIAGVLAAVLQTGPRPATAVAALAFVGALATRLTIRVRGDDQVWFDGRAVAESVKTQAWRYMMRAGPFARDREADDTLASELSAILHARPAVRDAIEVLPPNATQLTATMRQIRRRSLRERVAFYIAHRLAEQTEWYRTAGIRHARAARRWSVAAIGAESGAVAIAASSLVYQDIAGWGLLGLFAALAAAFSALGQLSRHGEVAKAYALAYQELLLLQSLAGRVNTERRLEDLVTDGEVAISREHTMWIARRATPLDRLASANVGGPGPQTPR